MPDMSKFSKDSPAQARERLQWQLDAIRANQHEIWWLLQELNWKPTVDRDIHVHAAKTIIADMNKSDRDAILQEGGILTSEQIELLK